MPISISCAVADESVKEKICNRPLIAEYLNQFALLTSSMKNYKNWNKQNFI